MAGIGLLQSKAQQNGVCVHKPAERPISATVLFPVWVKLRVSNTTLWSAKARIEHNGMRGEGGLPSESVLMLFALSTLSCLGQYLLCDYRNIYYLIHCPSRAHLTAIHRTYTRRPSYVGSQPRESTVCDAA